MPTALWRSSLCMCLTWYQRRTSTPHPTNTTSQWQCVWNYPRWPTHVSQVVVTAVGAMIRAAARRGVTMQPKTKWPHCWTTIDPVTLRLGLGGCMWSLQWALCLKLWPGLQSHVQWMLVCHGCLLPYKRLCSHTMNFFATPTGNEVHIINQLPAL